MGLVLLASRPRLFPGPVVGFVDSLVCLTGKYLGGNKRVTNQSAGVFFA